MQKVLAIATLFLFLFPSISYAAISFDATAHGNTTTANTLTISHTVAGSGECDVVYVEDYPSDTITSVQDNGVNMTLLNKDDWVGGRWLYSYELNPAPTGTTNVVLTESANTWLTGWVFSYAGCAGVDAYHLDATSTALTSFSGSITTSIANDWVTVFATNGSTLTDTWGGTSRYVDTALNNSDFADKAVSTPASVSVSYTSSGSQAWNIFEVALKPTSAPISHIYDIITSWVRWFY